MAINVRFRYLYKSFVNTYVQNGRAGTPLCSSWAEACRPNQDKRNTIR